jgi:hypothetical protein
MHQRSGRNLNVIKLPGNDFNLNEWTFHSAVNAPIMACSE